MRMEYTACALHAAHPNGKPHLNCQGHLESAALIGPSLKKNQAAKGSEPTVSTVNMRTPQVGNDGTQWEKNSESSKIPVSFWEKIQNFYNPLPLLNSVNSLFAAHSNRLIAQARKLTHSRTSRVQRVVQRGNSPDLKGTSAVHVKLPNMSDRIILQKWK